VSRNGKGQQLVAALERVKKLPGVGRYWKWKVKVRRNLDALRGEWRAWDCKQEKVSMPPPPSH